MGTSIMITSGKGGTGKTSFTAGVASCLAALGKRVLCVDLDIGLRNLDIALGMTDRALMDFTDVMDRRCTLLSGAVEQPDIRGLYLLTAPVSGENLDEQRFHDVIEEAAELFDFVLLDSPAGLGDGFRLAACAADRAIVVSATDPAALRDGQRAVMELLSRVSEQHLVVNRVDPALMRRLRTTIDDAMDTAGLPLLGVIPEDSTVSVAASAGIPVVLKGGKPAARAYLNIAKRLLGQKVPVLTR